MIRMSKRLSLRCSHHFITGASIEGFNVFYPIVACSQPCAFDATTAGRMQRFILEGDSTWRARKITASILVTGYSWLHDLMRVCTKGGVVF